MNSRRQIAITGDDDQIQIPQVAKQNILEQVAKTALRLHCAYQTTCIGNMLDPKLPRESDEMRRHKKGRRSPE